MRIAKFLRTFDPPEAAELAAPVAQPAAPLPPAAILRPVGESIPVTALPHMFNAIDAAREAATARERLAALNAPPPVAAPVAAPVVTPAPEPEGRLTLSRLEGQLTALTASLEAERLENYRLQQIAAARAQGRQLIDALVVGRNRAEIDATLAVAVAEYNVIAAEIAATMQQQAQQVAQQQAQQVAPAAAYQQQAAQGLPGVVAVGGMTQQADPNAMTMEEISQLTSQEALRDGRYLANRHRLTAALRAMAGENPRGITLNPRVPAAPPAPNAAYQSLPGSVQQPQFQATQVTASPLTYQQTPTALPASQIRPQGSAAPMQAVHPAQLEAGAQLNVTAARQAAQAAVIQAREAAARQPAV